MHFGNLLCLCAVFTMFFQLGVVAPKASKNCTVLLPRLDVFKRQILSRQKRGIIFPNKAFVLISQAFTKAIIDGRPPGLSYSIEFDMYSPLPDTIEGWQPTILNQKIKNDELEKQKAEELAAAVVPPAPAPPTKATISAESEELPENVDFDTLAEDYHYVHEHYIEDNNDFEPYLSPRLWTPIYNITSKHHNFRQQQHQQMANFYRQQARQFSKPRNRYESSSVERENENTKFVEDDVINNWPPSEEAYESEAHVPEWKYHHGYRERRHLFEQIETLGKIFNFDMKACIQRAMCELRSNLPPYGESLVEDIVRIILTIPKKLKFHDDYSFDQHAQGKPVNCAKHFKHSCPYRVLDFLTSTLRTATVDEHAPNDGATGIVRKNTS